MRPRVGGGEALSNVAQQLRWEGEFNAEFPGKLIGNLFGIRGLRFFPENVLMFRVCHEALFVAGEDYDPICQFRHSIFLSAEKVRYSVENLTNWFYSNRNH